MQLAMKQFFNLRTIIGALAFAAFLLCGVLVFILLARPFAFQPELAPVSSALTLIPAPTSTPRNLPFISTTETPISEPSPTPLPGEIAVGLYVQITDTGGDGLRLRPEPGLASQPIALGYDTEIFQVVDGPRPLDNRIWWLLVSPYDASRSGWAVADYLTVISPP
jgi:hypothetical protein